MALLRHVLIYGACLSVAAGLMFPSPQWLPFVWVNCVLHFATDYATSRLTSKLFMGQFDVLEIVSSVSLTNPTDFSAANKVAMKNNFSLHNFFIVVGIDQLIHQLTLAGTMILFFGRM